MLISLYFYFSSILYLSKQLIKTNGWIICVTDHNGILKSEFQILNIELSLTNISKKYCKIDADDS